MSVAQDSHSPLDMAPIETLAEMRSAARHLASDDLALGARTLVIVDGARRPARMVWIRMRRCDSDCEPAAYPKEDLVFRLAGDDTVRCRPSRPA
jgi:hypothetical protein